MNFLFKIILIIFFSAFSIDGTIFKKQTNKDVLDGSYLILSLTNLVNECLFQCNLKASCFLVKVVQSQTLNCELYKYGALSSIVDTIEDVVLYQKIKNDQQMPNTNGLIHYWPISVDTSDIIGNSDLTAGQNAFLAEDRFGAPLSAIYCNNGYYHAPPGVYFNGDYTIIVWAKLMANRMWSRIIDFSNGATIDEVILTINSALLPYPISKVYQTPSIIGSVQSSLPLELNQWYHLATTLKDEILSIFINGISVGNTSSPFPFNVTRSQCYIGRSSRYPQNQDANAFFDDLKIYNRALDQFEIIADMNYNF